MRTEEKKREMKKTGKLTIPNALLFAAGIPRDRDLVIETVPGVILVGIQSPVETVRKPLLDVFEELGIEPKEVEALMRGKGEKR